MSSFLHAEYPIQTGDYTRAGEASADIKRKLKQLGVGAQVMRRVAVASYEVELNQIKRELNAMEGQEPETSGPGGAVVAYDISDPDQMEMIQTQARQYGFDPVVALNLQIKSALQQVKIDLAVHRERRRNLNQVFMQAVFHHHVHGRL